MNNTKRIIYWHQFGLKIYSLDKNLLPNLEKEIESNDFEKIETELNYLSGQNVSLVLADSICYLYEKIIDPPLIVDNNFRNKLLEIIKQDIPEDFSQFFWDFKIKKDPSGKQKVIIFAPIKKTQEIISQISAKLAIEFDIIEPESISASRDPNPIIGIFKKTDIKGKDEDILNLSLIPLKENSQKSIKKIILILLAIIIIFFIAVFLINKFKQPTQKTIIILTPTSSPTSISAPTSTPTTTVKGWSDLTIMVQNGTKTSGLAAKTATIIRNNGINQINVGNADSTDYTSSKLIFKDVSLQEAYQDKFKNFLTIKDNNISIDNKITYDVVIITTTN